MDILFRTSKLRKLVNEQRRLQRKYGNEMARAIRRRLDDLSAAEVLEDCRHLPGSYHELIGDKKGLISADLRGPYRLLFVSVDNPILTKPDGSLDWSQVRSVMIVEIEDTHE